VTTYTPSGYLFHVCRFLLEGHSNPPVFVQQGEAERFEERDRKSKHSEKLLKKRKRQRRTREGDGGGRGSRRVEKKRQREEEEEWSSEGVEAVLKEKGMEGGRGRGAMESRKTARSGRPTPSRGGSVRG
jgi:hypothetical protein